MSEPEFGQIIIRAGDWTTKTVTFEQEIEAIGKSRLITIFCDQITSVFEKPGGVDFPDDHCLVATSDGKEFVVPMTRADFLQELHK